VTGNVEVALEKLKTCDKRIVKWTLQPSTIDASTNASKIWNNFSISCFSDTIWNQTSSFFPQKRAGFDLAINNLAVADHDA
jgi:hypothetical protein